MAKTKADAKDVVPERSGTTDLLRGQVENLAGPSTGTIVRFEYTFDRKDEIDMHGSKMKRKYYTYAAVWINDRWYLTGNNSSLSGEMTNLEFLQLIATEQTRRASVAGSFDSFKP